MKHSAPLPTHRSPDARYAPVRRAWTAALLVAAGLGATPPAHAREYDLPGLLALAARYNPGLQANHQATRQVEAQLAEARRSWLPTGDLTAIMAPAPALRCEPSPQDCRTTVSGRDSNLRDPPLRLEGFFTRNELRFTLPLFTFGKISSGIAAAEAGVAAAESRELGQRAELELNVKRAYYGYKLMREILATLDEARGYLDEAEQIVQKDLDEGGGNMSVADKLRLETARAELDARFLEARKGQGIALAGLRALVGIHGPQDLAIDGEPLALVQVPDLPLRHHADQARLARPEARALEFFARAKLQLARLEWNKQLPDLVLVGTARYAYASSVDDPFNAFYNDPFNTRVVGLAAALSIPIDFGQRHARAMRLRAEAEEAELRRQDALGGIAFEVERAHTELAEARERVTVVERGEKLAKRWISSIMQKMQLGLTEVREVSDALTRYFTMRVLYLQAIHDFNLAAAQLTRATGTDVVR